MYEAQISASASDTGKLAIINFNEFQNEFQSRLGMNLEDADEELIRNMLDIIYLPKLFYLQNYVNNYAVIYDWSSRSNIYIYTVLQLFLFQ